MDNDGEHAPSGEAYKTQRLDMEAFASLNEQANSSYQSSMVPDSSSRRYGKAESRHVTPAAAEDRRTGLRTIASNQKEVSKPAKGSRGGRAQDRLFRSLNRSVKKVERESKQAKQEQMVFMKQDLQRSRG